MSSFWGTTAFLTKASSVLISSPEQWLPSFQAASLSSCTQSRAGCHFWNPSLHLSSISPNTMKSSSQLCLTELSLNVPCWSRLNKCHPDYRCVHGSLWLGDLGTKKIDYTRNWRKDGKGFLEKVTQEGVGGGEEYSRTVLSNRILCKNGSVLYLHCPIR